MPGTKIADAAAASENLTVSVTTGPANGRAQAPPGGTRLVIIGPPRQLLVKQQDCAGPLAVCHTAAGLDVALAEPRHRPGPPRGGYLIEACGGCEVQAHLEEMPGGWTALAMWHEPGCRELAGLLRQAGV